MGAIQVFLGNEKLPTVETWNEAIRAEGFDFILDPFDPRSGYGRDVPVRPAGFIRFHEKEADGGASVHMLSLELDRSKESQQSKFVPKAESYFDYYRRGGLAERFGGRCEEFRAYPFQVLFVVPTEERRNNMAAGILTGYPLIRNQVWLSTLEKVKQDPLGPIWITPGDYDQATAGMPYAPDREPEPYKTRLNCQAFVEERVVKRSLFEE